MPATRQRTGLTLIELMVALAIIAILVAIGVPSLRLFMMQQRLKATAAELLADVQLARSASLTQRENLVTVTFGSNASTTCYAVVPRTDIASSCDCTKGGASTCADDLGKALPASRLVSIDRTSGVSVTSTDTLYFQAINGMMANRASASALITATPGGQLQLNVSATGLPSLCVPAGSNITGFPACK